MEGKLKQILKKEADLRGSLYNNLVSEVVAAHDLTSTLQLIEFVLLHESQDHYGVAYTVEPVIINALKAIDMHEEKATEETEFDLDELRHLYQVCVEGLRPIEESCADALFKAVNGLKEVFLCDEDTKKAALIMSSYRFEHGTPSATPLERVTWFVTATELFLATMDPAPALKLLRACHPYISALKAPEEAKLNLRYHLAYARTHDYSRSFIEAAKRYQSLSLQTSIMSQADMLTTLQNAVTCAILGKAGPSRHRVLGILYADPRSKDLPNYDMLIRMYRGWIIRVKEAKSFEALLQPHQLAYTQGGRSVMDVAIIEHNMRAAGNIYVNIRLTELASLLGISPKAAEETAAGMISEGRLHGILDQVTGMITFNKSDDMNSSTSIVQWDLSIENVCQTLQGLNNRLAKKDAKYVV